MSDKNKVRFHAEHIKFLEVLLELTNSALHFERVVVAGNLFQECLWLYREGHGCQRQAYRDVFTASPEINYQPPIRD